MTNDQQNRLQGQKLIESGALVVNGDDPAHKISKDTHPGQLDPFKKSGSGRRDAQAVEHGKAFTPAQ